MNLYTIIPYSPNNRSRELRKVATVILFALTLMAGLVIVAFAEETIPVTGFDQFDAMYHHHMNETDPRLLEDVMTPVNDVIFFLIKLQMRLLGSFLLLIFVSSLGFAIWYSAKPEFADRVSEVKDRVASGEKIPFDEPMEFAMQFMPDIKANSGIADSYEYERPTIGLMLRDNLAKFILLFAIAIALTTNVITTFVVKGGFAIAKGAEYYVVNTDFVGIVNTMTTSGNDYDPMYDTLTTEGRNKKKVFNSLYQALKREKPRVRTQEFLDGLGAAVSKAVAQLEQENDVVFSYENFTADTHITSYKTEFDQSLVKTIKQYDMNQFLPQYAELSGRVIYLTVFQYDNAPSDGGSSGYGSIKTYENGWEVSNGKPTGFDMNKVFPSKIKEGYKYSGSVGSNEVTATAYYSGGDVPSETATVTVSKSDGSLSVNLSELRSKIDQTTSEGIVSLRRVEIRGLGKISLVSPNNKKTVTFSNIVWTP